MAQMETKTGASEPVPTASTPPDDGKGKVIDNEQGVIDDEHKKRRSEAETKARQALDKSSGVDLDSYRARVKQQTLQQETCATWWQQMRTRQSDLTDFLDQAPPLAEAPPEATAAIKRYETTDSALSEGLETARAAAETTGDRVKKAADEVAQLTKRADELFAWRTTRDANLEALTTLRQRAMAASGRGDEVERFAVLRAMQAKTAEPSEKFAGCAALDAAIGEIVAELRSAQKTLRDATMSHSLASFDVEWREALHAKLTKDPIAEILKPTVRLPS
jgi:hypothetical protein